MKPLHYLLIIFVVPPLIALALGIIFVIATSRDDERPDPRPTGTLGIKKGGRIGSPSDTPALPRSGGDFR
ncbi:hypothetical protein [Rhizobium sp. WYJ-E13]|uniref:hypothetical protein n=1 Tax=Rhizobium sp. WYJ-E13 TaxID=2849093 RepID=UPI001C1EB98C|nr:hypothetical protein [Rhizobium sp. WYJ-E13]QWW70105.1 hypothetical protein KQ933_10600 [Rhizobium sp. WYJ-E13]